MPQAGHNYFRVHPKGNGILVRRPSGLPPVTFVSEYLGEMHTPARWFEIQVHLCLQPGGLSIQKLRPTPPVAPLQQAGVRSVLRPSVRHAVADLSDQCVRSIGYS